MDQDNQVDKSPDVSADFLMKRRRGRPRKYPRLVGSNGDPRDPNFGAPPGYGRPSGYQSRQRDPNSDTHDVMVGQPVNGVIEAAFDAGYLLSVRVGNSQTMLRGVVFRPGHYVPVSVDNDVAPDVPMIRRNNVRAKRKYHSRVRGCRSRDYGLAQVTDRQLVPFSAHSAQPAVPRGYLVPVVLQRANLPNGGQNSNQPSGVANQVPTASNSSSGSLLTNQVSQVENRGFPSQPPCGPSGHGKPFETLLSEVMKRGQAPTPSAVESEDQALSIEPLQAIHPVVAMPKHLQNFRAGKMTELLQVNMRDTQASQTE